MKMDAAAFVADRDLLEALKNCAIPVNCDQDRVLFRQGESAKGLYICHHGEVEMTMTSPSGDVLMRMPAAEGSLLGLPGVIGNVGYSLSAYASKGAVLSYLSREAFSQLMLSEPSISVGILRVLAAEVRTARIALVEA